jgi:choline dehydrogenase
MVYIRGDKAEFDAWEALGNEGWNWDSLYPYFKLSENFTIPTPAQVGAGATYEAQDHGESGYLTTGFPYQLDNSSFHVTAQQTWEAIGVPPRLDLNGGDTHGFAAYPQTLDRDANVRESSARAYYQPVESRPNLHIIKGTVKRVTWTQSDGEDLVASGVEYLDPTGQLINITAGKEVILSAGSFRTPLILELSGVGNPRCVCSISLFQTDTYICSILGQLGIDTVIELPGVGESTHDQPIFTIGYSSSSNYTGHTPFVTFPTVQDVFGPNTSAIAASTSADLSQWAQTISASINGAISPEALETRFRVQHDLIFKKNITVAEILTATFGGSTVGSAVWLLSPFSWGSVHLQSPSSINTPVIDSKLLSVDFDLDLLIGSGRLAQKVWNTPPLSTLTTANVIPGDAVLPANASDSQWEAYIKNTGKLDLLASFFYLKISDKTGSGLGLARHRNLQHDV